MPPVWLLAFLVAAWRLGAAVPVPAFAGWAVAVGPLVALAGVLLLGAAALEFRRARTSIIPGDTPDALISSGVYRWSRNPIYLADTLILLGAVLYGQAVVPLLLVPAFVWIVGQRFIRPEEARLKATFPLAFAAYESRVRRWI